MSSGEGARSEGLTSSSGPVELSVLAERKFSDAENELRSLTIGSSDNLCGCSGVVWTSPRDIGKHFGDEEFVEQGKTSTASVVGDGLN
jgi:hypothetical protein